DIVAAGVHHAWNNGGVRQPRRFVNWQRIDVAAQGNDRRAARASRDPSNQPGVGHPTNVRHSDDPQRRFQSIRGLVLRRRQLRVLMNVAPERDQGGAQRILHPFMDGGGCHTRAPVVRSISRRTVRSSMRSTSIVTPSPGASSGTRTMPSASIVHSGVTTSRAQYRALGERSPGSLKFGSDASATLYARPTPLSSIPPHQTGMAFRSHRSWMAFAVLKPPTRPGLMLTMRPLPNAIISAARSRSVIDSSRQIGVRMRRWSAA